MPEVGLLEERFLKSSICFWLNLILLVELCVIIITILTIKKKKTNILTHIGTIMSHGHTDLIKFNQISNSVIFAS